MRRIKTIIKFAPLIYQGYKQYKKFQNNRRKPYL